MTLRHTHTTKQTAELAVMCIRCAESTSLALAWYDDTRPIFPHYYCAGCAADEMQE